MRKPERKAERTVEPAGSSEGDVGDRRLMFVANSFALVVLLGAGIEARKRQTGVDLLDLDLSDLD